MRSICLAGVIVASSLSCAEPESGTSVAASDAVAASIDRSVSSLRSETTVTMDFGAEGSRLDAHYRGTELRLLTAVHSSHMALTKETYYFDPLLFLVRRERRVYAEGFGSAYQDSSVTRAYLIGSGAVQVYGDTAAQPRWPSHADTLIAGALELRRMIETANALRR